MLRDSCGYNRCPAPCAALPSPNLAHLRVRGYCARDYSFRWHGELAWVARSASCLRILVRGRGETHWQEFGKLATTIMGFVQSIKQSLAITPESLLALPHDVHAHPVVIAALVFLA